MTLLRRLLIAGALALPGAAYCLVGFIWLITSDEPYVSLRRHPTTGCGLALILPLLYLIWLTRDRPSRHRSSNLP